jgi:hypothetical protein
MPSATRISGARECDEMEPRAVPSHRIPLEALSDLGYVLATHDAVPSAHTSRPSSEKSSAKLMRSCACALGSKVSSFCTWSSAPDNQIVLRSNGEPEVVRSFGEDLKNVAHELTAPPEPGDTTH